MVTVTFPDRATESGRWRSCSAVFPGVSSAPASISCLRRPWKPFRRGARTHSFDPGGSFELSSSYSVESSANDLLDDNVRDQNATVQLFGESEVSD
jgi:hypothetical protein